MSEELLIASFEQVCQNLLAIRKERDWVGSYTSFDDYLKLRWSLSKTRGKLFCSFALFSNMAREAGVRMPDTPDNIAPLLNLPQKQWLDAWEMVCAHHKGYINAVGVLSTLDFYGLGVRRRVPAKILKARKIQAAARTLAHEHDGEKLVEDIGAKGLGHDWDMAVKVVIDADQAKMDKNSEE